MDTDEHRFATKERKGHKKTHGILDKGTKGTKTPIFIRQRAQAGSILQK
jgi:hypothetical protein